MAIAVEWQLHDRKEMWGNMKYKYEFPHMLCFHIAHSRPLARDVKAAQLGGQNKGISNS